MVNVGSNKNKKKNERGSKMMEMKKKIDEKKVYEKLVNTIIEVWKENIMIDKELVDLCRKHGVQLSLTSEKVESEAERSWFLTEKRMESEDEYQHFRNIKEKSKYLDEQNETFEPPEILEKTVAYKWIDDDLFCLTNIKLDITEKSDIRNLIKTLNNKLQKKDKIKMIPKKITEK